MRICSIEDCNNQHRSLGYCTKHYRAFKSHGDPLINKQTPRLVGDSGDTTQNYTKICAVEDCAKDVFARGWCSMHYARWQRHGDPLQSNVVERRERIYPQNVKSKYSHIIDAYLASEWTDLLESVSAVCERVQFPGIEGLCWIWPAGNESRGYPDLSRLVDGKPRRFALHRIVLEARLGRVLHNKMQSHHQCSQTRCCNPEHLEEATGVANTAEMKARQYYIARIAELESALRIIDPTHPIL